MGEDEKAQDQESMDNESTEKPEQESIGDAIAPEEPEQEEKLPAKGPEPKPKPPEEPADDLPSLAVALATAVTERKKYDNTGHLRFRATIQKLDKKITVYSKRILEIWNSQS